MRREVGWSLGLVGAHVVGSLAMTTLGILIVRFFAAKAAS
jgi:hypothetical protein